MALRQPDESRRGAARAQTHYCYQAKFDEGPAMNLNDSQIGGICRRQLDDELRTLAPDAQPTPFMVGGGPHGVGHVGLHNLADPDFAETAMTVIPAFIVLDEAVEVALGAFVTDPAICGENRECALIAHWGPPGRDLFISSVTRRKSQPPILGGFVKGPVATSLGPIDDGVRRGMEMARGLWDSDADELRGRIAEIRAEAAVSDTDVLPRTVDALRQWGWLT
jgi:hypothetical protein